MQAERLIHQKLFSLGPQALGNMLQVLINLPFTLMQSLGKFTYSTGIGLKKFD